MNLKDDYSYNMSDDEAINNKEESNINSPHINMNVPQSFQGRKKGRSGSTNVMTIPDVGTISVKETTKSNHCVKKKFT